MAVTSVSLIPGRSGSWDKLWQRTYKLRYRVECSDRYDGPVVIRTATHLVGGVATPLLPRIGAFYKLNATEQDVGSFVVQEDYEEDEIFNDGGTLGCSWVVTISFGPYEGGTFGTDPTQWPVLVSFGQENYQRIVLVDRSGVPILNSAGCPYQDPVQADDTRSTITVVRNEAVGGLTPFDFTKAETYRNTVNDAPWNGFAAKTVMCTSITTGQQQYDSNNQVYFFEVTYVFHVNRDTWTKQILDQGKQVLGALTGLPITLRDENGDVVDEPVLLNGSGQELASGGTPVFRSHEVMGPVDFSAFNIDFSVALGR